MAYAIEDTSPEHVGMVQTETTSAPRSVGQPQTYRIARVGARPLKFSGSELAMAMSFTPEIPFWYEINIYRTTEGDFVTAVRLFHQSEDRRDTAEAWRMATLEDALSALEHYDAGKDVDFALIEPGDCLCASELGARALDLQARIMAQRKHYGGLVGEVLYELDNT
ncbi:MAG: hypothetical protein AAGA06_00190 [Pseudomonadota bacterium]